MGGAVDDACAIKLAQLDARLKRIGANLRPQFRHIFAIAEGKLKMALELSTDESAEHASPAVAKATRKVSFGAGATAPLELREKVAPLELREKVTQREQRQKVTAAVQCEKMSASQCEKRMVEIKGEIANLEVRISEFVGKKNGKHYHNLRTPLLKIHEELRQIEPMSEEVKEQVVLCKNYVNSCLDFLDCRSVVEQDDDIFSYNDPAIFGSTHDLLKENTIKITAI